MHQHVVYQLEVFVSKRSLKVEYVELHWQIFRVEERINRVVVKTGRSFTYYFKLNAQHVI